MNNVVQDSRLLSVPTQKYNVYYFTFGNCRFKYSFGASLYPSTHSGTRCGRHSGSQPTLRRPHQECRAPAGAGTNGTPGAGLPPALPARVQPTPAPSPQRTHPPHAVDVVTLCSFAHFFLVLYGHFYVIQHIFSNTTT